jgi:hypothetical protein
MKGSPLQAIWGAGGARLLAGDIILISMLAAGTVILLLLSGAGGEKPEFAEVETTDRRAFRLDLAVDAVREAPGPLGTTRVEVREGRVRVIASPCPLKICVKAGWIERAGEMVVCLPNEIVVRLPGSLPGGIDAVSR